MKFSIITPSYNSEEFIAETIESVISQEGDFHIEYIVVDNCSKDRTADIVRSYAELLQKRQYPVKCNSIKVRLLSQKDNGMYAAVNQGFSLATGDIFAWINADDVYLPQAFDVVDRVFRTYSDVKWVKGITSYIDRFSKVYEVGQCYLYDREWIRKGVYGRDAYFIQQDSVFWRSELWKAVGYIRPQIKLAGDFFLWARFAEYADLYSVKAYVSCFRKVEGQLSEHISAYKEECNRISPGDETLKRNVEKYLNKPRIPEILHLLAYLLRFPRKKYNLIDFDRNNKLVRRKVSCYVIKKPAEHHEQLAHYYCDRK